MLNIFKSHTARGFGKLSNARLLALLVVTIGSAAYSGCATERDFSACRFTHTCKSSAGQAGVSAGGAPAGTGNGPASNAGTGGTLDQSVAARGGISAGGTAGGQPASGQGGAAGQGGAGQAANGSSGHASAGTSNQDTTGAAGESGASGANGGSAADDCASCPGDFACNSDGSAARLAATTMVVELITSARVADAESGR